MSLTSPSKGRNLAALTCSLCAGAPCFVLQEQRAMNKTIYVRIKILYIRLYMGYLDAASTSDQPQAAGV